MPFVADLEPKQSPAAALPPPPSSPSPEPSHRRRYWLALLAVVVATIAISRLWPTLFPPPPVDTLTASGRIEGREITLAPKDIQARVSRLLVDEGQTVQQGQLLAELESAQLDARRLALAGTLASLDAQIAQAALDVSYTEKTTAAAIDASRAAVSSAHARVAAAQALEINAGREYRRAEAFLSQGVVAERERDQAQTAWHTSRADLDAAEKDVARAEANLTLALASADTVGLKEHQLRALRETRRAMDGQIAEADAYLAERQIVAPTAGTILSRPAEVGDVVSPGSPVFQMIDMSRLYVKVYVPEPDIGRLRLGDSADVIVDAFPNQRFAARISKIHDQAEFTPKNVETAEERLKLVFGVELAFVHADPVLKPGMPADCILHVSGAPVSARSDAR